MDKRMDKDKKKTLVMVAGIITLIVMTIGVTYAAFVYTGVGTSNNKITTGTITMVYTEGVNKISIENALPMTDEEGKKLSGQDEVFDFTVEINITGDMGIAYEVTAQKVTNGDNATTLDDNDVKLYLEKSTDNENFTEVMAPSHYNGIAADQNDFGAKAGEMIMESDSTSYSVKYYYKLRMWIDKDYQMNGQPSKKFTVKVNVYGKDDSFTQMNARDVSIKDSNGETTDLATELDNLRAGI